MEQSHIKNILLPLARETIELFFAKKSRTSKIESPFARGKGACFITLQKNNSLRGCCGTIFPYQSLIKDIQTNALQAAFHDPRFPILKEDELSKTHIELSILSKPQSIQTNTEKNILTTLRPHIDGVVLEWQEHKSTFLPLVWDAFPEKELFFAALKKKAGLSEDFWAKDMKIFTYTTSTWKEVL